jgi:glycosyltransferase involved in cell wall biosynthesis
VWATQVYPRREGDPLGAFLHALARELPARGFAPVVVAPGADDAPPAEERDGVRVVRFDYAPPGRRTMAYTGEMHVQAARRPALALAFLRRFRAAVAEAVARERPAVVHAHWWAPSGWAAAAPARRASVPLVLSLHGTDVRLLRRWPPLRPVARGVFRTAARVLPVSAALRDAIDALGMPGGERIVLPMPPAAPVPAGAGAPEDGAPPVERAGFLVAARLTAQKRVDVAVEAVCRLAAGRPEARLVIAGDGPERARLEARVAALGAGDRVTFRGMVPGDELARLYRSSVAVLLPSEQEGYGLTLVEGALHGTPAVGARSGGIVELIRPEVTGLLFEPGDEAGLAAALRRLLDDPALARRMGAAAREAARGRTAGPLADRLAGVYRETAAPAPR